MKNKLTVKQFAAVEGVSTAAIYLRVKRKTLKKIVIDGLTYIYINSNITGSYTYNINK